MEEHVLYAAHVGGGDVDCRPWQAYPVGGPFLREGYRLVLPLRPVREGIVAEFAAAGGKNLSRPVAAQRGALAGRWGGGGSRHGGPTGGGWVLNDALPAPPPQLQRFLLHLTSLLFDLLGEVL